MLLMEAIEDNFGRVNYFNDLNSLNENHPLMKFEEVKPDKIKLLLKDEFEVKYNNRIYTVNKWANYAKIIIKQHGSVEHEIRWGVKYDTALTDIQPILDVLNIEIVEESPKYKIDVEGEYTEEELKALKSAGIKFKKVGE